MGTERSVSFSPTRPGPWLYSGAGGWAVAVSALAGVWTQPCLSAASGISFSIATQDLENWLPQPNSQETDLQQEVSLIISNQKVLSLVGKSTQETKLNSEGRLEGVWS